MKLSFDVGPDRCVRALFANDDNGYWNHVLKLAVLFLLHTWTVGSKAHERPAQSLHKEGKAQKNDFY